MNLEARFQLTRGRFTLNASFDVPAEGVIALFGPSGAGKSTVLRCLAGLERAPGGICRVGGETWQDDGVFVPVHERSLGYVFQDVSLFPFLTVEENLRYGWNRTPETQRRVKFEDAVEWLGLPQFLSRKPDGLSGGEKQRVAMARAILTSPRLLLMDEPLAALDVASKNSILPKLRQLPERFGMPIVYVSHSVDEIAQLADRMILLENGTVQATGPLSELLTRLDLPLARQDTALAVLDATVAGYDEAYSLTRLTCAAGEIQVPRRELSTGQAVRVVIHARDVSLSLSRPVDFSVLNVIPATVVERVPEGPALEIVRVESGGVSLLSRVTRKSAETLRLQPGTPVFAMVKSVALLE